MDRTDVAFGFGFIAAATGLVMIHLPTALIIIGLAICALAAWSARVNRDSEDKVTGG